VIDDFIAQKSKDYVMVYTDGSVCGGAAGCEHVQLSCIRPRPSAEKPVTKLELSVERFVSMSAKSTASFLEYTWLSTISEMA